MIPQPLEEPPQQDAVTFMTNFYDTADEILNLLVHEQLWATHGFDVPPGLKVQKTFPRENIALISADGRPVAGIYQNFNESKWILYGHK